mgnify:CR=1 FL=1
MVEASAWKSRQVAAVYEHADVSEEARKVASPHEVIQSLC